MNKKERILKDKISSLKGWIVFTVIICIMITFTISYITYLEARNIGAKINIPNSWMIEKFCKENGFDNGWLSSSSCGINEVQCHRNIIGLEEYKCIKWEKK